MAQAFLPVLPQTITAPGRILVRVVRSSCETVQSSIPEALANIREAIHLCLEDMESRGTENVLIGSVVVTR